MKIRICFNQYYLKDIYVNFKSVPRRKDALIIPYEMLKFKDKEKDDINDDVFIVHKVLWDLENKETVLILK